jgi:DNA-binding NarL/FixJ family response regulator
MLFKKKYLLLGPYRILVIQTILAVVDMNYCYKPVRVIIADDHEFFREGLKVTISKYASEKIEVVSESENGKNLLLEVSRFTPDVVLMDIKMPIMDGIEATRFLTRNHPTVQVIAISSFDEDSIIYEIFEAGAKGYLLKNANREEIFDAIHTVGTEKTFFSNYSSKRLLNLISGNIHVHFKKTADNFFCEKEIQIIQLICKEYTTKEIAYDLHLSQKTIEDYSRRIKVKTGAKSIVGIALCAVKSGLVCLDKI